MRSLILFTLLAAMGCDSSVDDSMDASAPDAAVADAPTSDAPMAASHCGGDQLLIAAIEPMVSVTLFNPTDTDMDLSGTGWVLCQRPNYIQLEMIESGVTIEAGGSHTYAFPSAFTDQGVEDGELVLYRRSAFTNPDAQVDYVCWGSGRAENRRSVADEAGLWMGDCAPSITGTRLTRRPDTDGRSAASYDAAGASGPLSCPAL